MARGAVYARGVQAFVMDRYGGPAVMRLCERPEPTVGPRDVRIRVRAASLNPIDWKLRQGKAKPVLKPALPAILGCDVAGVIDQLGAEVTGWKVGDEVFARLEKDRMGALAEYVAADQAVMSLISLAMVFAISSCGIEVCIAIIFIMSPCTFTLPAMNACMPAAWSCSTKSL